MTLTYPITRGNGGPVAFYIRARNTAEVSRALIAMDSGDLFRYSVALERQEPEHGENHVLNPRLPIFTVACTLAPRDGIDGRLLPT